MHHFARPFGSKTGLVQSSHRFPISHLLRVLWHYIRSSLNNIALCDCAILMQTLLLFQCVEAETTLILDISDETLRLDVSRLGRAFRSALAILLETLYGQKQIRISLVQEQTSVFYVKSHTKKPSIGINEHK